MFFVCKLSIHTIKGASRHKAGKRDLKICLFLGLSGFLTLLLGVAIFKCSSVFTNFHQARLDPRSFGGSRVIFFLLGSFLFQLFRTFGLLVLNIAKLLPLPALINGNFILQKQNKMFILICIKKPSPTSHHLFQQSLYTKGRRP